MRPGWSGSEDGDAGDDPWFEGHCGCSSGPNEDLRAFDKLDVVRMGEVPVREWVGIGMTTGFPVFLAIKSDLQTAFRRPFLVKSLFRERAVRSR